MIVFIRYHSFEFVGGNPSHQFTFYGAEIRNGVYYMVQKVSTVGANTSTINVDDYLATNEFSNWVMPDGITNTDLVSESVSGTPFAAMYKVPQSTTLFANCVTGTTTLREYQTNASNVYQDDYFYEYNDALYDVILPSLPLSNEVFDLITDTSDTLNSSSCQFQVNDLSIDSIVISGSYTATINASGTYTPFTYSLTNDTYQSSNAFAGLSEGIYTAYVKDANGAIKSQTFEIVQASQAKFKLTALDDFGNTVLCEIFEKGYVGSATEIQGSGNYITINTGNSGDEKWNPMKGSRATLNLISTTDFQFITFLTGEEDKYSLKVSRAGNEIFRGYLIPEGYKERYDYIPYNVSFNFYDGLGNLKNKSLTDENDKPYSGYKTALEIIRLCLKKTYLNLGLKVSLNYWENNHTQTASNTPLAQIYLNCDTLQDLSCYDIIKDILTPYYCRIYQTGGYWHIKGIYNLQGTYTEEEYSTEGVWIQTNSVSDSITTTVANTANYVRILNGASLSFRKSLKELRINQENKRISSNKIDYFQRPNFFANLLDPLFYADYNGTGYSAYNGFWTGYQLSLQDDINYKFFPSPAEAKLWYNNMSSTSYIEGNLGKSLIELGDGAERDYGINLSFKYKFAAFFNSNFNFRFYYQLQAGAYFWDADNSAWTLTSTKNALKSTQLNEFIDFEVTTSNLLGNGDILIRFYRPESWNTADDTDVSDDSYRITVTLKEMNYLLTDSGDKGEKITFTLKNTSTFSEEEDIDLKIGERTDMLSAAQVYKGVTTLDAKGETFTKTWNRSGGTDALPLMALFGKDILNQYSRPYRQLRCTIKTDNEINIGTKIIEYYDSNRVYTINQIKYNPSDGTYSLDLDEYITENNSLYLLKEDGFNFLLEDGSGKILLES